MKPRLFLAPLEPYKARYTELLDSWERRAFQKVGFRTRSMRPPEENRVALNIQTGEVLDSVKRPMWAVKQIELLLRQMEGHPERTHIYFSDFFHPGLEALPYSRRPFTASSFCWAQSFDQFDFTRQMVPWMRPWELMAMELYKHVFVANEMLKELICTVVPSYENKVHVVGLPFHSRAVGRIADLTFGQGVSVDCVYSSRWDKEKNPELFLQVAAACPDLQFAICTATPELRGSALTPAMQDFIARLPNLTVFAGLTKGQYYAILNNARVQFNCALQDWVSFTLLEALTFDCMPLYPNYRSFPETFLYENEFLYRPSDAQDAVKRLRHLLENTPKPPLHLLDYHDGTLTRIANILLDRS